MARAAVAAAAVSLAVGIAAAPRRADACSFVPMSRVFSPAAGEVHPASAGMLMMLSAELDELFSVTVDGAPASLVIQQELLLGWFDYDIVAIEPAPMPGQTVVLSQCGTEGSLEHARCPPGSPFTPILDFTIGPDDVTSPSADGIVALSHVIEHVDDPCSGSWEVRFLVSLTGFDQTDEPDVLYRVELRDSSGEIVGVDTRHVDEPAEAIDISITFETVPADAVDHCVSVTAFDLSGNETLLGDVCGSNGPAPETGDTDGTSTTGSDESAGADPSTDDGLAPGGSTDGAPIEPDATTTEDPSAAELEDRGCACAASSRPAPPIILAWSMLLLVVRRTRFRSVGARTR
jgi:MYXO-CTERM domain-containing protein